MNKTCLTLFFSFLISALYAHDLLFFYHIPKCGGTTVSSLISQKYPADKTLDKYTKKKIFNRNFDASKYTYIRGHVNFYRAFPLCPNATNITFLREPVERVLSLYRYYKAYHANTPDFYEFYSERKNFQVRSLSSYSWTNPNISLEQHLQSAKDNLQDLFFFVGITERMGESLEVLYKMMGWSPLTITPTFNTTTRPDYSQEILDYLKEEEWADVELYHFANSLFDGLSEKAKTIQSPQEPIKSVDHIQLTFDQPFEGEGWGYREHDGNTYYRTSFLENAYIDFPLKKGKNYKLEFKACFMNKNTAKGFEVLVNGKKIQLLKVRSGGWSTFQATIPQSLLSEKMARLTFRAKELFKPSDHGSENDQRTVGVSLSEVSITPIK